MSYSNGNHSSTSVSAGTQDLHELKLFLADRIGEALAKKLKLDRTPEVVAVVRQQVNSALEHKRFAVPAGFREQFINQVIDEIVGYGPLEPLLADPQVTEIMVNGAHQVYAERNGKTTLADVHFENDDHVVRIINKIVQPLGRRIDKNVPLVDARLPDGSRVNAVIPPCAIDGPTITIRKFAQERLGVDDLLRFDSLNEDMAYFLEACVAAKLNIVVSGGTGSGKTTLLNIMSSFIPETDRIVTIEDAAELRLQQPHVVRLETRHADSPTERTITIRDLVRNSLRMRPDRIVIGECRGGEALDMLQAMNTGHDGSLTTVHANSPRDSITRLETLVMMSGLDMPISIVRRQIASAVDLIVQQARLRDGSRKVISITELTGMEGENVVMQDIFKFDDEGSGEGGKVLGEFRPSGLRPNCTERLKTYGYKLPASMFMGSLRENVRRRR